MDVALRLILPDHKAIVSLKNLGTRGKAILVHPEIDIVELEGFQKGEVAWAIVFWKGCKFGVMNVYA